MDFGQRNRIELFNRKESYFIIYTTGPKFLSL